MHAIERAYVAAATGGSPPRGGSQDRKRALAALGAIASRYLAVGTPRTLGLVADASTTEDAITSVLAHRAFFRIPAVRCATPEAVAVSVNGVITSIDEALACDIVCLHVPIELRAVQLRRGTHVNVLAGAQLDDDLASLATVVHEVPGLGQLAAGLVDGRQLDELTVFIAGDAAIALGALA